MPRIVIHPNGELSLDGTVVGQVVWRPAFKGSTLAGAYVGGYGFDEWADTMDCGYCNDLRRVVQVDLAGETAP